MGDGVSVVLLFIVACIRGWVLMLLLGIFAGYTVTPGLAIGFWASVGISLLWSVAKLPAAIVSAIEDEL